MIHPVRNHCRSHSVPRMIRHFPQLHEIILNSQVMTMAGLLSMKRDEDQLSIVGSDPPPSDEEDRRASSTDPVAHGSKASKRDVSDVSASSSIAYNSHTDDGHSAEGASPPPTTPLLSPTRFARPPAHRHPTPSSTAQAMPRTQRRIASEAMAVDPTVASSLTSTTPMSKLVLDSHNRSSTSPRSSLRQQRAHTEAAALHDDHREVLESFTCVPQAYHILVSGQRDT